MSKSKYAGALLITPDYKIIFQQRDNRPGIINPGQITTFGGAVEDSESSEQAIVRELKEELDLDYNQPKLYQIFQKTKEDHGEDREMYIYLMKNVNPASLTIYEGQGCILISETDNLSQFKLTTFAKELLEDILTSRNPSTTYKLSYLCLSR